MTGRKIILFGGTFDPVHLGHTTVAAAAVELVGAEKLIFIPAKRSPLKSPPPIASDRDRLKMVSLAIADSEKFDVDDYELQKTGPSYTLDTIRYFKSNCAADDLIYWLLGADSINELPRWYKITDLIDECNLCTMRRPGSDLPDFTKFEDVWGRRRVEKLQKDIIQTPLVDISSTEIRKRLTAGEDVSEMLAPAVADYIKSRRLYQKK